MRALPLSLATFATGCALLQPLPPRSAGLLEATEPADKVIYQAGVYGRGHPRLGAEAEGLLLPAASRWGRTMRMNTVPDLPTDSPGAQTEYYFYGGLALPRPLWFGCKGPCPPDWTPWPDPQLADGTYERFSGKQFGPGMANPWGLDRAVELVRIEVNGGKGGAQDGIKLVATRLESVEGLPGYPKQIASLFDGARALFDRFVAEQAETTRGALQDAARTPRGWIEEPVPDDDRWLRFAVPGPERELAYEAIVPTWLPETRTLQIVFLRRVARIRTATVTHFVGTCGTPAREVQVPLKSGYGAELGQLVELDAAGALVRLRNFTPAPMSGPSLIEARLVSATARQPPLNCRRDR
jgi:hypothetical protein